MHDVNLSYSDAAPQSSPFFEQRTKSPATREGHTPDFGDDGHMEDRLESKARNPQNDWTELTMVG